jgi:Domain of Unknown Function (DUF1080)
MHCRWAKQTLLAVCLVVGAHLSALAAEPEPTGAPNQLTADELANGWILLFDGESMFGWQANTNANWHVADGTLAASEGERGLLNTTSPFADYELKLEFRRAEKTNSGVFLRTVAAPTDPEVDCYELNIAAADISPWPSGSFARRLKASASTDTADKWSSFEVSAVGGHFIVKLDGQQVLDYTDPKPLLRGLIGLQFNTGSIEFRSIKLRPLSLQDLLSGTTEKPGDAIAGWTIFPDKPSVFTIADGTLSVKGGDGQLESQQRFGDFVLQTEVFSNGPHLNSGIFFRCIPGEFWQGYECQIQNGFKNDDRAQPEDCGTGGFYRRQNARRVMADDFAWFPLTLVVAGNHMAAWVAGYPVSDWTDTRKPKENPRQGQRLEPGTLAIQGHDTKTDLSFRKMRAAEMPTQ